MDVHGWTYVLSHMDSEDVTGLGANVLMTTMLGKLGLPAGPLTGPTVVSTVPCRRRDVDVGQRLWNKQQGTARDGLRDGRRRARLPG